jgi:hypothetical protein
VAEFEPRKLLETLVRHGVDFVLIGGMAGAARGSAFITLDVDVACDRSEANLERLAEALRELEATLRGAPPGLPFVLDARTLSAGANFTFDTRFGPLDILSDPPGAPAYATLREQAGEELLVEGISIRVASLDHLIAMKEAAGRPRDLLAASEYRVISDELRRPRDGGAPEAA